MCDCYEATCAGCGKEVPVHIGDFAFDRDEVEAWCGKHIPEYPGVEVSVMTGDEDGYKLGDRFGLRLKRGELSPSEEGVCINLCNASLFVSKSDIEDDYRI